MYKILIADDREVFRRQFKRLPVFKNSEFEISFETQNGEEALEILRENKVDLVITDIRMPIMDGIELLSQIKKEGLCECVVFLSEYAEFSYAKQGMLLGAFDYIVKPIENEEVKTLLQRVSNYLSGGWTVSVKVTDAQINRAAKLVLSGDEYFIEMIEKIAVNMVQSSESDAAVIENLNELCSEIGNIVLKERSYLDKLLDTDKIFSFGDYERNEIVEKIHEKAQMILNQSSMCRLKVKNELIQSVCDSILKNLGMNISLQTMANLHYVNKAYLSHLFSRETGMSFLDYVNMIKMEYAKKRIVCSSDKIYEIALELDYSDTEYFSKVFKQYTGYTPSAYRTKYSSEENV